MPPQPLPAIPSLFNNATSAAESPPDEPGRLFDGNYKKGVWNIMPVSKGDHGTPIGLCVSKEYTHNLYDQLVELMKNV